MTRSEKRLAIGEERLILLDQLQESRFWNDPELALLVRRALLDLEAALDLIEADDSRSDDAVLAC